MARRGSRPASSWSSLDQIGPLWPAHFADPGLRAVPDDPAAAPRLPALEGRWPGGDQGRPARGAAWIRSDHFGLPTSQIQDFGPFLTIRLQRRGFQLWKADGPAGIKAGQLVEQLGSDRTTLACPLRRSRTSGRS